MADGRSSTVALPAVVDLDALDGVRDQLLDAVDSGAVTVDGANVERLSTNALIMLISAAEAARRNSYSFALEKASPQMLNAIDRLGLRPSFAAIMRG